jgi:hypothetical protein
VLEQVDVKDLVQYFEFESHPECTPRDGSSGVVEEHADLTNHGELKEEIEREILWVCSLLKQS